MRSPRAGLLLIGPLLLAACGGASAARPASPTGRPPSARRELTLDAWRQELAAGRFTEAELASVGERQEMAGPIPPDAQSAPPGTVWRVTCMPGGGSDTFATERATGHLWRVTTVGRVHAPEGVIVSATRCHAQAVRLPEGAAVQGTVVVDAQ